MPYMEGFGWVAADNTAYVKRNATAAPTSADGSSSGFSIGSMWFDVENDKAYVCVDPTDGAAVWAYVGADTSSIESDISSLESKTARFVAPIPFSSPAAGDYYEFEVPVAANLVAWRILADAESDIQFDLWKDTYANYPPTNDDSMCDGNEPALSSATKGEATDLSAWTTTTVAAGDIIRAYVDSVSTEHTLVTLVLVLERS